MEEAWELAALVMEENFGDKFRDAFESQLEYAEKNSKFSDLDPIGKDDIDFIKEHPLPISFYLHQLETQCIGCMTSIGTLHEISSQLKAGSISLADIEAGIVWPQVYMFSDRCAKAAEIIGKQGMKKGNKAQRRFADRRASVLLKILRIIDSPDEIRQTMTGPRNRIEHFYEDFDKWYLSHSTELDWGQRGTQTRLLRIGDAQKITQSYSEYLIYDPLVLQLHHMGKTFDLNDLANQVASIATRLNRARKILFQISPSAPRYQRMYLTDQTIPDE